MDSHPAVSTSVREVVSLFEEDTLEGVRFPDLDLETLLTSGKSPFPERVLCSWLQVGAREVTY